ncbi:diguanylate cyclase (GGDEF) domain-containing protein [Peptoclostridium litorale DSM 5388]|uniref:Diguanylate cyclase and metal dependent phosphohydrolase n=1 Tax=Peptoclostridium litorale DSM 5388 TaxID=1121324 RepID=A0A069REC8_PEPLI|nr:HD domain-containing phosphohydrolase [Peptoclostridium litorale]KDR95429.1 diguanylate cyclase and metal dependent phosphohydrolase [Peptoclostridium litorale DSM 5388]SIO18936.1 diguanylate cyclase (GGDEF) domain-containing protein [Peptoclostridium litorale DSM 5388]
MKIYNKLTGASLQKKFRMFVSTIILILVSFQLVLNNFAISGFFSAVEKRNIEKSVDNTVKVWNVEAERLTSIARDYGIWSEAYEKLSSDVDENAFFKENFMRWIPFNYGVDIVSIIRKDGKVIKHHGVDLGLAQDIMSLDYTKKILASNADGKGYLELSGYTCYNSTLYIISIVPVLMSDYSGEPAGVLVIADRIDDEMLQSLKERFGIDIFFTYNGKIVAAPPGIRALLDEQSWEEEMQVALITDDKGESYAFKNTDIYGIGGKRIGSFGIVESISMLEKIESITGKSAIGALIFALFLVLAVSSEFKREVIMPVKRLEEQVTIMNSRNTLVKLKESGPVEIVRLTAAFNGMVEKIARSNEENKALMTMSKKDELTGLYNHRYFHETFEEKVDSGIKSMSIILADVDKFKNINSAYGYGVGDLLLEEIAKYIKRSVPKGSEVFRYGGEEFVVMLMGKNAENARPIAERLRIGMGKSFNIQRYSDHMPVTMSMGIASYPADSMNSHGLVRKGEIAMHYAKSLGRNIVSVYNGEIEAILFKGRREQAQKDVFIDSVIAITKAVDAKDEYTGMHSDNVAMYSLLIAEKIDFSEDQIYRLRIGALLHDCGKIGIPDVIINKPSKLNEIETEYIRKHPMLGYNIVKGMVQDDDILSCVRYHHERWDGRGYPDGLKGEEIPLYARIVCIADSFHAMVSDRSYRKGLGVSKALHEIEDNASIQFDPYLARVFVEAMRQQNKNKGI